MSIREVLERVNKGDVNAFRVPEHATIPYVKHLEGYKELIRNKGAEIFESSGVYRLLNELVDTVRSDFPDAKIKEPQIEFEGILSLELAWNSRTNPNYQERRDYSHVYDRIKIEAFPLSGDLAVLGHGQVIVHENEWLSEPEVLEDALVWAYQNPQVISARRA